MDKIKVFDFEVNAIYAKEELLKLGIESSIIEIKKDTTSQYELLVEHNFVGRARKELDRLNLDENPLHKESEGYLEEVEEWNQHMYNPVYYLEHKKFPHFFYEKFPKRLIGYSSFVFGVIMLFVIKKIEINVIFFLAFGLILIIQSYWKKKA